MTTGTTAKDHPLDLAPVPLACGHTVTAYRKDAGFPSLWCGGCRKPVAVEGARA